MVVLSLPYFDCCFPYCKESGCVDRIVWFLIFFGFFLRKSVVLILVTVLHGIWDNFFLLWFGSGVIANCILYSYIQAIPKLDIFRTRKWSVGLFGQHQTITRKCLYLFKAILSSRWSVTLECFSFKKLFFPNERVLSRNRTWLNDR